MGLLRGAVGVSNGFTKFHARVSNSFTKNYYERVKTLDFSRIKAYHFNRGTIASYPVFLRRYLLWLIRLEKVVWLAALA